MKQYSLHWKLLNVLILNLAELNRFALSTIERELQPREPVHFYFPHPLLTQKLSFEAQEVTLDNY